MMNDDDFKLLKGFALGQTNKRTDICNCRVAFAAEKGDVKSGFLDKGLPVTHRQISQMTLNFARRGLLWVTIFDWLHSYFC